MLQKKWPWLLKLPSTDVLDFALWPLGVFLFAAVITPTFFGLAYPLEIDSREGSQWLQAIAKAHGVDLYDYAQVSFINMNHGLMDPLLKGTILRGLEAERISDIFGLPPQMINRLFCLMLPFALLGLGNLVLKSFAQALVWASLTMFALISCCSFHFISGRPDVLGLLFLVGSCALTHKAVHATNKKESALFFALLTITATLALLSSWRIFPFSLILSATAIFYTPKESRLSIKQYIFFSASGLLGVTVAFVCLEMGGNFTKFYRHFFHFFISASNSGSQPPFWQDFSIFFGGPNVSTFLFPAVAILALVTFKKSWLWSCSVWLAFAIANFSIVANAGGADGAYYAPAFLLLWFAILQIVPKRLYSIFFLACALLWIHGAYWGHISGTTQILRKVTPAANAFVQGIALRVGQDRVLSTDSFLWKADYRGETIDMGDLADNGSTTIGADFDKNYQARLKDFFTNPPKFFLSGPHTAAPLRNFIEQNYTVETSFTEGYFHSPNGGTLTLYKLKAKL